jgi:hypothetical protein
MAVLLSYALTTKADVKESLGIPSANTTKDNLIIRKINQATIAIERYCHRRFLSTTYTDEEYSATGTDQLVLRQRPIISVSSFSIRDTNLNQADWDVIDSQTYFAQSEAGVLNLLFRAIGGTNRYKITYTAGYATIPEDLAEACASLACFYVNNADASDIGVAQKKEGQRQINYSATNQTFASVAQQLGIDSILDSYANNPLQTDR